MKEGVGNRGKVQKEERSGGKESRGGEEGKEGRGRERGGKEGGSDALFHFMAVRSETR